MSLYVYALLDRAPRMGFGLGLCGEILRPVRCGKLVAVVGEMEQAPAIEAATLRRHDDVVRRLAAGVEAILPVRFGSRLATERALQDAVDARSAALREALALVAGREQMTVRIFQTGEKTPGEKTEDTPPEGSIGVLDGPGTRYLRSRAEALPELAALRPALAPLVAAERVQRHQTLPLLASVYHLIRRGECGAYVRAVELVSRGGGPLRLRTSGPRPPYAFAPGVA